MRLRRRNSGERPEAGGEKIGTVDCSTVSTRNGCGALPLDSSCDLVTYLPDASPVRRHSSAFCLPASRLCSVQEKQRSFCGSAVF